MGADLAVEHGPARAVNGVVPADSPTPTARATSLGFCAEVELEEGLRSLVDWWRAEQREVAGAWT